MEQEPNAPNNEVNLISKKDLVEVETCTAIMTHHYGSTQWTYLSYFSRNHSCD